MEHKCENCGKTFEPTCHKSRQRFCSSECRVKYHNSKRYAPPGNACAECGAKLDPIISKGRNRRYCSDECRKLHNRKKLAEKKQAARNTPRVCPNCGREFLPMFEHGPVAKFCCDECRIEWWKEYHRVTPEEGERRETCAYCGGRLKPGDKEYCSRVCYRLGSAQKRGEGRCGWCGKLLKKKARKGQKYCSTRCAALAWTLSERIDAGYEGFARIKEPEQWRRQLTELARGEVRKSKKEQRIYVVSGVMKSFGTDALADFIRYELKGDPFDGNRYVFCCGDRSQLKWIEWDGGGFCVGTRRCEWGKYSWPRGKVVEVMEIAEWEYEYLKSGGTRQTSPEGW